MPIAGGGGGGSAAALAAGSVLISTGDLASGSTSFVDATGATVTITTGAHRCLVTYSGMVNQSAGGNYLFLTVAVDGTSQGGTHGLCGWRATTAVLDGCMNFSFLTAVLGAGSHTIKLQMAVSAGTGTLYANATNTLSFAVLETAAAT